MGAPTRPQRASYFDRKNESPVVMDYSDELIAAVVYTACVELAGEGSASVDLTLVTRSLPFESPDKAVQSLLDRKALVSTDDGFVWLGVEDEEDLLRAISLIVKGYPLLVADERKVPPLADILVKLIDWHRQLFVPVGQDSP